MEVITLERLQEGMILVFDKPLYWTSFDLVNKVRKIITIATGQKVRVGHAGTLDPMATGLMVVCTGRETKNISAIVDLDKEYIATIRLGATTPSYDLETEIDATYPTDHLNEEHIRSAIAGFVGEQMQVPPVYSAKLIDGTRAYELARKGIMKEPVPVKINIKEAELLAVDGNDIIVRVVCSKGTYIRSLARDIGKALGSGACLAALKRTMTGKYKLKDAVNPDNFEKYVTLLKQNASKFV